MDYYNWTEEQRAKVSSAIDSLNILGTLSGIPIVGELEDTTKEMELYCCYFGVKDIDALVKHIKEDDKPKGAIASYKWMWENGTNLKNIATHKEYEAKMDRLTEVEIASWGL